jgi:hypothetical protein
MTLPRILSTSGCNTAASLLIVLLGLNSGTVQATETWTNSSSSKHWLLDADDDMERFRRLERYLGGFAQAMREVGFRYRYTYLAINDGNYELAGYHWDKIQDAIIKGYLKRPARRANAEEFLDGAWQVLNTSLKNGDAEMIRADFKQARKACMECHKAEDKAFLNDQGLFRDTVEFPRLQDANRTRKSAK